MDDLDKLIAEREATDPEYKRRREETKPQFEFRRALIDARKNNALKQLACNRFGRQDTI